jgi:hypothetical protein
MSISVTRIAKELTWKLLPILKRLRDISKGFWPPFLALTILKIKHRNPKTYQDKLKYKMAYDRRNILQIWADKSKVRKYVEEMIGHEYLNHVYGIFINSENISIDMLPRNFVVKANHGSGAVIIVSENAPKENFLPKDPRKVNWERFLIHPDSINWSDLFGIANRWMKLDFYKSSGHYPEWAYKGIPPRIIIEKFLDEGGKVASDYRFFIFNGSCKYIEVDCSWSNLPTRNMFDREWNEVEVTLKFPPAIPTPSVPPEMGEMILLAEKLANGVDHVRVDFYLVENKIIFGEMTNYHTSGQQIFYPHNFNYVFAKDWEPRAHY